MTDRELLEKAAKAAGIDLVWNDAEAPGYYSDFRGMPQWEYWNPLVHNGAALVLAVKLRLDVSIWDSGATVTYERPGEYDIAKVHEHGEPLAATRRAIVMAAAKIGERA